MEFEYDPELIRELAQELVPGDCAAVCYQRAAVCWYAEVYAGFYLDDLAAMWDAECFHLPKWEVLTNPQRNRLLAEIALCQVDGDQEGLEHIWRERLTEVIEGEVEAVGAFLAEGV